jgi:hypothetical protein
MLPFPLQNDRLVAFLTREKPYTPNYMPIVVYDVSAPFGIFKDGSPAAAGELDKSDDGIVHGLS